MTTTQARETVNSLIGELPKARKKVGGYDTYICPFCGNGSGKDGDGISTRNGKSYKCFKCGENGDYLHILRKLHNASEAEIFERYGLEIDGRKPPAKKDDDYFSQANKALHNSSEAKAYLKKRGLSLFTADRFSLGFVPDWRSPAAVKRGANPPADARLIIPTGKGYTARALTDGGKYRFVKEGEAGYFGREALYGANVCFVVEGALDALSVAEAGGSAVALGSTSGVNKFLELLDSQKPTARLVLALDNDAAGQTAQAKLAEGLTARGISFSEANICGGFKDQNEALVADREGFTAAVNTDYGAKRLDSAASYISSFLEAIDTRGEATPTGFPSLDAALDGGLYEGLYVVGAISSLGKTTFALQMADAIAYGGRDVLFFSLEMSRFELMAKSVSRLTFECSNGNMSDARTARAILTGDRRASVERGIAIYGDYAERLFIHEGIGDIGAERVREEVARHAAATGEKPVVIIDYLQILAPAEPRATDKQNTDRAVLELKRLSRDFKIPVIAVSSFNRENYTAPVNLASFKESGAIEYSSDVLLGLQLSGMDELSQAEGKRAETMRQIEAWKKADPRKAQLKLLKNRNGRIGVNVEFKYYTMFNCFREG